MLQRCGDGQYGVVGTVEAAVEVAHIGQGGLAHMTDVGPDSGPAVRVHRVAQWTQQQPYVAVRLVHVALVVLLGDHMLLHLQRPLADVEVGHAVGLQP